MEIDLSVRCRHPHPLPSSHISMYGASVEPPKDDVVFFPEDDNHSFFASGRDYESAYVNHKYTLKERETLATFESFDYFPSHSQVYKHWIKRQPARLDWDRWLMMGLIGFLVGIMGFLLHQIINVISDFKWEMAQDYIHDGKLLAAWGFSLGYSVLFVLISAGLVVFVQPSAVSSGIPELIGFLNGTVVHDIFNIKIMVVKFVSCICAVGSGMPVGPEGPMIHLGSLVGAGLSQFKSDMIKLPFFERFRNSEDRRNFLSAGAAAGVASAFGAPVGGLLFSMEEVSSFWNQKLSWQIFFCAMISTVTTDLLNSAFSGFVYDGDFGLFKADKYIIFYVSSGIAVNILAFIPAAILGVIGGFLGALFTFINLKIARARKKWLARVRLQWLQQLMRLLEPVTILVIFTTISVFLPAGFSCSKFTCMHNSTGDVSSKCLTNKRNPMLVEQTVRPYTCPPGIKVDEDNYTWTNNTFNQVATLLFVTGEEAIHHLFSRDTHHKFDLPALFTVLPIYFLMACWASGTSISSGILVPMLMIGSLYGRIIGRLMVHMFGVYAIDDSYWAWMDPGAFALIGAASFFGGVSRLTMSLTVIMMEITNDIQFLLPIMTAVIIAKWIGDYMTHPYYHALLELKCIPFLDAEPVIVQDEKHVVNLELFSARDIMTSPVHTLNNCESVANIAKLLLHTNHGGFPVLKAPSLDAPKVFFGLINRLELMVLLQNEDIFHPQDINLQNMDIAHVEYQLLTIDKLSNPRGTQDMLEAYAIDEKFKDMFLTLDPYVNQSAISLPAKFSLHRTYIIFRTLGLRHLTVVNETNEVVGIITRKDLMGFNLEDKLQRIIPTAIHSDSIGVEIETLPLLTDDDIIPDY